MEKFLSPEQLGIGLNEAEERKRQQNAYGIHGSKGYEYYFTYRGKRLDPTYIEKVLDPLAAWVESKEGSKSLLEVAAGLGQAADCLAKKCPSARVFRTDINSEALRNQPNAFVAAAWDLYFSPDGAFIVIHFKDGLTHIAPQFRDRLFAEFFRVLAPGGKAVIVSAPRAVPGFHQYVTSLDRILLQVAAAGFEAEHFSWRPLSAKGDWYSFRSCERFVIILTKPADGEITKVPSDIVNP